MGRFGVRGSRDDGFWFMGVGLCGSHDYAYDVMIMIAGYYELYHSDG